MSHQAIFNGDGHYCSACGCSWDQGESPPAACVGEPGRILIGLAGEKGAGKDTAAQALLAQGFENVKMAGALKAMLRALLEYRGAAPSLIDRMLEGDLKETPTRLLGGRTPRYAMQTLGTQWGRDMMHKEIWVDATEDRCEVATRAVITDVRFQNEADMVKRRGGRVYRVDRLGLVGTDAHESEALISSLDVDGVITNAAPTAPGFERIAALFFRAELRAHFEDPKKAH